MYNGIGLQTPRGSGTNGHVQRNWALVRPSNKDKLNYRSEEELAKLDAASNRQPNKEILDHERKRKIELKCVELEEILEEKGYANRINWLLNRLILVFLYYLHRYNKNDIETKVENYRKMLMGVDGKIDMPKDEWGRVM